MTGKVAMTEKLTEWEKVWERGEGDTKTHIKEKGSYNVQGWLEQKRFWLNELSCGLFSKPGKVDSYTTNSLNVHKFAIINDL